MIASTGITQLTGAGTNYLVITNGGVQYAVFVNTPTVSTTRIDFSKSTDGGVSWSTPTAVSSFGGITQLSIWYDRWSGISGDLIHCAYVGTTADATTYRSIDAANSDTLSSEITIFDGGSTANGGALSITRARGGNLYVKTMIDAGSEGGFFRSVDVGANWTSRTDSEALATTDQWILLPSWNADDQDAMMFFWDASADEISRCLYDNSGDSWAESSIAATMVDLAATTNYPNFAAAVDTTNSRNLLAAWSDNDIANADLRVWHVTESAITEVTNVITNSTDDQGLCGISIDTSTEDWYVFYFGNPDGGETYATILQLYYKKSTDDGATWGSNTAVDPAGFNGASGLFVCPRQAASALPSLLYRVGPGNLTAPLIFSGEKPTAGSAGGAHILGGTVVR